MIKTKRATLFVWMPNLLCTVGSHTLGAQGLQGTFVNNLTKHKQNINEATSSLLLFFYKNQFITNAIKSVISKNFIDVSVQ